MGGAHGGATLLLLYQNSLHSSEEQLVIFSFHYTLLSDIRQSRYLLYERFGLCELDKT